MTSLFRLSLLTSLVLLLSATPSLAGKGGSAGQIKSAVASGSVDAIIAEIERAEALVCPECVDVMTNLLDHPRYEVREAAGWWFAKRPALKAAMVEQMVNDLGVGTGTSVRNAADFLGAVRATDRLPALSATYDRGVSAEARLAIVRAAGAIASSNGNALLQKGFADADGAVRLMATTSWRDMRGQSGAAPLVPLLSDSDAVVRAEAAATIGGLREQSGRTRLEALVTSDSDATVRRNAAWALGELGSRESAAALDAASKDASPLVRGVARAARRALR